MSGEGVFRTADLDYKLPPELIAQHPIAVRDRSRLLIVDRAAGGMEDAVFDALPSFLEPSDLLILNNTKVLPAKFVARRPTGGRIEGLFLRDHGDGQWEVLLKGTSRLKSAERLALQPADAGDAIDLLAHEGGGRWTVRLVSKDPTEQVLERVGRAPLPPYIRRNGEPDRVDRTDRGRYQTVYAAKPGAVAAPTAGLHFTEATFDSLRRRGVEWAYLTLHVGFGTFAPLHVESLDDHQMHAEWYELDETTADRIAGCRKRRGRLVAVGTTSARVLETCADKAGRVKPSLGSTDLFIRPPYAFQAVDALLTNFHLPRSTLLALVMSFAGPDLIRSAYAHAVEQRYRFYSYGDAMLIL